GAVMDMISAHPDVRGVLHSYSGSAEMARQLCERGWMISLSGVVTFKNARQTVEVAEKIPLSHLLLETDAPYLTPVPHRGKTNHSGYLVHTAARIAEIRGISEDEVRDITRENACRFFGIPQKD
ncbi:MAG: TatD family hydrolase, partial [Clostridia bacterium]|nr:TatD family hydrolase [Clostridia bacterium]